MNSCDVEVERRIDNPVAPEYMAELRRIPEFVKAFDEKKMTVEEFESYGAFRNTLSTFIAGYDELCRLIRGYMI